MVILSFEIKLECNLWHLRQTRVHATVGKVSQRVRCLHVGLKYFKYSIHQRTETSKQSTPYLVYRYMSCLEGCKPRTEKTVTSSFLGEQQDISKSELLLSWSIWSSGVVSISCSSIKKKSTKIGQAFGVTVNKACSHVYPCFLVGWANIGACSPARVWFQKVIRQRSSAAGLESRHLAPVTQVGDWKGSQAFVRFESKHQYHCMEHDVPSEQQHTEEPMDLGGIRSRSSSSGTSSRR